MVVSAVVVVAGLLALPFILSGEMSGSGDLAKHIRRDDQEVTVFAENSREPQLYTSLAVALREMAATIPVGSAIAVTPVQKGNVIIAKNNDYWRTIPPGVVFFLEDGFAEIFMDHAEFELYLKKHPELERAGVQALRLEEFFNILLNKEQL